LYSGVAELFAFSEVEAYGRLAARVGGSFIVDFWKL
jgi:hypothetical protein